MFNVYDSYGMFIASLNYFIFNYPYESRLDKYTKSNLFCTAFP